MRIIAAIFGAITVLFVEAAYALESEPPKNTAKSLYATKPFVPTVGYEQREIEGWKVRVNRELADSRAELGTRALELLAVKLRNVRDVMPAHALG
ncbi:MAG: hypothetical protein M3463_23325, partial [Verrucomicrobiota bacterium]|nr:hypothetical protein [Verrucomicrobiota bacterium]